MSILHTSSLLTHAANDFTEFAAEVFAAKAVCKSLELKFNSTIVYCVH